MLQLNEIEHMEAEPQKKDDAWAIKKIQVQQFDRKKRNEALAQLKKKCVKKNRPR